MSGATANFLQRSVLLLALLGVLAGQAFAQQHLHTTGDDTQTCEFCAHSDQTPSVSSLPTAPLAALEFGRCLEADLVAATRGAVYPAYLSRAPPTS